jgi:hypothetical protein
MYESRQFYLFRQIRQDSTDLLETEAIETVTGHVSKTGDGLFSPIDMPIGRSLVKIHLLSFKLLDLQQGYRLIEISNPSTVYTVAGDPSPTSDLGVYVYSFLAMQETEIPVLVNEASMLLTEDDEPILTETDQYILIES